MEARYASVLFLIARDWNGHSSFELRLQAKQPGCSNWTPLIKRGNALSPYFKELARSPTV